MVRGKGMSGAGSLFGETHLVAREEIAPGAFVLWRFALAMEAELLRGLREVTTAAPFRNMVTPGGYRMSVAMTFSSPCFSRRATTSSEPIWPAAPVTKILPMN